MSSVQLRQRETNSRMRIMPFIRSGCRLIGLLLLILISPGCSQPERPWSGTSADGRVGSVHMGMAEGVATVDYWRT